jgi:hypothetical protein
VQAVSVNLWAHWRRFCLGWVWCHQALAHAWRLGRERGDPCQDDKVSALQRLHQHQNSHAATSAQCTGERLGRVTVVARRSDPECTLLLNRQVHLLLGDLEVFQGARRVLPHLGGSELQ